MLTNAECIFIDYPATRIFRTPLGVQDLQPRVLTRGMGLGVIPADNLQEQLIRIY